MSTLVLTLPESSNQAMSTMSAPAGNFAEEQSSSSTDIVAPPRGISDSALDGAAGLPIKARDDSSAGTDVAEMDAVDDPTNPWIKVRSSCKRKKSRVNSADGSSTDTVVSQANLACDPLTVILVPLTPEQRITDLSSIKVSQALEQLCPECILEVRYNVRLNLIAVNTRNGMASRELLKCTLLCSVPVRAYAPYAHPVTFGVISNVDIGISDEEIACHLRTEVRIVNIRRLGTSTKVKLTFHGAKLPEHILLGHVRHPVTPFRDRPLQCRNCCGFGHIEAACRRPAACSNCAQKHRFASDGTCTSSEKCVNCGSAHSATSSACPKWLREKEVISYARAHGVGFRSARVAVCQPTKVTPETPGRFPAARKRFPRPSTSTTSNSFADTVKSGHLHRKAPPQIPVQEVVLDSPLSVTPSVAPSVTTSVTTQSLHRKPNPTTSGSRSTEVGLAGVGFTSIFLVVLDTVCQFLSTIEAPWAQTVRSIVMSVHAFFKMITSSPSA